MHWPEKVSHLFASSLSLAQLDLGSGYLVFP